jgi:DNA-binding protein YbaB
MVTVEMNGRQEVLKIHLDPDIVKAGDVEMLEDLIAAAFHAATENAKEAASEQAASVASSLGLPNASFDSTR